MEEAKLRSVSRSHFILYVSDQEASRSFYEYVLAQAATLHVPGMTEFSIGETVMLGLMPEHGILALLNLGMHALSSSQQIRGELYLVVDAPEAYHGRALAAGAQELSPLSRRDWGDYVAYSLDPNGYVLAFAFSAETGIPMFECHTRRLLLRDFIPDDWTAIFALSQAPAVTRFQSWLRLHTEAEARQWVQQAIYHNRLQAREAYNLAIVHLASDTIIGWIGWGRPSNQSYGDYDFGYALLPEFWGQGYMTEALQAALHTMFETLSASQIYGECAQSNRASARVMAKNGLRSVQQWSEQNEQSGLSEIHERYRISLEEWQQNHAIIE